MVAINKRPVRLLCSPNPPRESRSRSFFFVLSSFHANCPLSPLLPSSFAIFSPPHAPEFPAVVISEPCEASQSPEEVFHQRGRRKNRDRPSPSSLPHLVVVQLLRVIVRVNGIAESEWAVGGGGDRPRREGWKRETEREPRRTVHVLRNQFLSPTYFRLADRDCTCHRDQFP